MSDPQKVEAGTCFGENGYGKEAGFWVWDGSNMQFDDGNGLVEPSAFTLAEVMRCVRRGQWWRLNPPSEIATARDAVIEAARKVIENAETASDSLPGGRDALLVCADVRVSAELLVALRTALDAAKGST